MPRLPCLAAALALLAAATLAPPAAAQTASRCLAVAQSAPSPLRIAYVPVQSAAAEVTIRFIGHSSFLITSPEGVTVTTDYFGMSDGVVPRVVTMNRAHSTHYTDSPDPRIEHVLRGWTEDGSPARHELAVGDVLIRNVTTDIRTFGSRVPDGNSIFIFETAQLCIGHLGHLHHRLEPDDLAWIGQLDVVMVPVDGTYTMDQAAMMETLEVLKARLVLPMHYFGPSTLNSFLGRLGEKFEVEISATPEITLSAATLPKAPKVLVLPGH